MKKFECPHCGEKTISPIKKAFAGNQSARTPSGSWRRPPVSAPNAAVTALMI